MYFFISLFGSRHLEHIYVLSQVGNFEEETASEAWEAQLFKRVLIAQI